jgi:hypothetical protein
MPIRKPRLTKSEFLDHCTRLVQLEQMGVPVESRFASPPDPNWLILEAIHDGTARIYDLPSWAIVIVIPARLSVLKSGMLITDVSVRIPWDDFPLELNQPDTGIVCEELLQGALPNPLPKVLNSFLKSENPLRRRCVEGLILAEGSTDFPAEYQDGMPLTVQLLIEYDRRNKLEFDFEVRVDRSVKRSYERRQQRYYQSFRLTQPPGQFIPPQPPQGLEENSSDNRSDSGSKSGANLIGP